MLLKLIIKIELKPKKEKKKIPINKFLNDCKKAFKARASSKRTQTRKYTFSLEI